MASTKTEATKAWGLCLLVAALFPNVAYAEPQPSGLHLPLLCLVVLMGAVLLAMLPLLIKRLIKPRRAGWVFWVVSILLGLLFVIFLGPIIIGVGSILITGRTM